MNQDVSTNSDGFVDDAYERFVVLFARSEAAVRSYILSLVADWNLAEDILQQSCLVMWRKFEQFELGSNFTAWALQIARFESLNVLKKRRRDRHVFNDEVLNLMADEAMFEQPRLESERRALSECIEKLDDRARVLLQSCYHDGDSVKEIASRMSCTPNSIYKALNRIRQNLFRCIQRVIDQGGAA